MDTFIKSALKARLRGYPFLLGQVQEANKSKRENEREKKRYS